MTQKSVPSDEGQLTIKNTTSITPDEYNDLVLVIDRKVKLIESIQTQKDFFLQVAEFYGFLTKNLTISNALEAIELEYKAESEKLNEIKRKVWLETENAFKDLRKMVLENSFVKESDLQVVEEYYENYEEYRLRKRKVTKQQVEIINQNENRILAEFQDYYSFLAGASQSLNGDTFESVIAGAVESIVRVCKELGYVELVNKYIELEKNSPEDPGYIKNYLVSPTDIELRERKKSIDRKLESLAWHAFRKIELVPLTIHDYYDQFELLRKNHNTIAMINLSDYVGEMNKVMDGKSSLRFNVQDYKLHLIKTVDAIFDTLKLMCSFSKEIKPTFKTGENVAFENDIVYFKVGDSSLDVVDLSGAPELLKVFKTFWELRKRNPGETLFLPAITIKTYQDVNKEEITRRVFSSRVSNLRQTKISPKINIRDRFVMEFDKKSKSWRFDLS